MRRLVPSRVRGVHMLRVLVRLGLNLVYLVPGEVGGMEVYARELITALVRERPDLDLIAFIGREAAEAGDGPWGELIPAVTVPVRSRNRAEWVLGEQHHLPRLAARAGVQLLHSLASTAPAWGPYRRVVTIHDLIYRAFPEAHFGLRSLGMRVLVPLAARRAHRVLADSRATRDDLVRWLGTPPGKVDVVPLGVQPAPAIAPTPEGELRDRLGLGDRPLALSVSAKRPHKNLAALLDALALLPIAGRPVLVVPGYRTPYEAELRHRAAARGVGGDVRWLDWVSSADLEGLYAAASCLVFPSLYEGFGLPVLEAMSRGVPVACSDRSSLPEVADDAALVFDALDPRSIAEAMQRLLTDGRLADRLREAGRAQAARFTWAATARGTAATYERALASPA